jgi:hypothetical protein
MFGVEERSQRLTPKRRWISTRLECIRPIGILVPYIKVISLLIIYITINILVTAKCPSNFAAVCRLAL